MYEKTNLLFMITETPLHVGSGQELGVVDLPIQREKHTRFPKIEASSLKGAIREAFSKRAEKDIIDLVFGPEDLSENAHAGAMGLSDARILLFPVKSAKGVFAWITCPMVLERFKKELKLANNKTNLKLPNENTTCPSSSLEVANGKVVLEEYTFEVRKDDRVCKLGEFIAKQLFNDNNTYRYWTDKMKKDIVVLSDDDFADFVELSTEVSTRIKIDTDTGTVKEGALFSEEFLPQDTVLYSLVFTGPVMVKNNTSNLKSEEDVRNFISKIPQIIQIGGDATIGKGIVKTSFREVQ